MRRILLLSLTFAACALAADVAGKWWGEAVIDGNAQPVYVTLIQVGNALKGSGGPTKADQSPLAGKVEGNHITFDIEPGGRTPLHFEVSPDGERLKGTINVRHNGQTLSGTVSLRRSSD